MKIINTLCMLAVVALVASPAFAQECKSGKCASSTAVATTATQDGEKTCSECPVAKAMANLPKMTYKVGEEMTCCDKSAAALAEKSEKPIHFVVGEKTFESKDKAYVSLVETTEAFVTKFTTACKCEKSGKTTIAGKSCSCPVDAGKKAELVTNAIKDMKVTYKVGEETTCCDKSASELAKKSGEKMTYVVAGKETCCSLEARLNLAHAKYAAAVKALASAETKAAPATEKSAG